MQTDNIGTLIKQAIAQGKAVRAQLDSVSQTLREIDNGLYFKPAQNEKDPESAHHQDQSFGSSPPPIEE